MLTKTGKVLRKLRLINKELLYDMANKLNMTSNYLSSIETGRIRLKYSYILDLTRIYKLPENFHIRYISEEDGSITITVKEFDIACNSNTKEAAKNKLAHDILEYANEYFDDFSYWNTATNRNNHLKHIIKVLLLNHTKLICKMFKESNF